MKTFKDNEGREWCVYYGKVSSISSSLNAITRSFEAPTSYCSYSGYSGTCTYDLFEDFTDCEEGVDVVRQIVVPLQCYVNLYPGRDISVVVYADVPGGSTVFQQSSQDFGPALEYSRFGETLFVDNELDCDDWPVVISQGGTVRIVIPPHG